MSKNNIEKKIIDSEDEIVNNMIAGGTSVIIAGMIGGFIGWILCIFASRPDIGFGATGYAIISTANSIIIILSAISGGFHQSISKYIAEGLVESKKKALDFSRAGSISTNIFGLIFFTFFIILSIISFSNSSDIYGFIYMFIGIALLLSFIRDNLIGNLAGIQKFNKIGMVNFLGALGGIFVGVLTLIFVPTPYTPIVFASQVMIFPLVQIIFSLIYSKKNLPYSVKSIYKKPSSWNISKKVLIYGLYSTIPQTILLGSIFWISTFFLGLFFSHSSTIVGISGIIIGYAGVMATISFFGWPQIPAVSAAKASNNQQLIDKLISQCFRTGFHVSIMFLVFYIGVSHAMLELFHTAEYLPGYLPFIILSISTTLIGLVFLIASMLIGLGKAKTAFLYISIIIISSLIITPILINFFLSIGNTNATLLAGPIGLLIPTLIMLPILFRYLPRFTNKPSKYYLTILIKGFVSVATANIISFFIENYIYPYNSFWNWVPTGFFLGIAVNLGIFMLLMCFLSALDTKDWELFNNVLGPLKIFTIIPQWISEHSPFYKPLEDNLKNNDQS